MEISVISLILNGFKTTLLPYNLLLMTIGMFVGIVVGILPGLTATMAVALLVPITFMMNPSSGIILLGAIWCGGVYGGSGSAVLINVPGTPSSFITSLDGFAMTQKGQADEALYASLFSSVIGGVFGVLVLLTIFAPLSKLSVKMGQAEYFWLCVFGLTSVASVASGNVVKGIAGSAIGLLLGMVGINPITGTGRYTFGVSKLIQGIPLIPTLVGLFAFSQMLTLVKESSLTIAPYSPNKNAAKYVLTHMFKKCKIILLRSSIIGTIIGILPGAGGDIAAIISYNEARRWDKNPERFGKGAIEGVIASETANNAMVGGACVPMLGLGIPGASVAAIIMGGLLAHGIVPGSQMMAKSGDIAYSFIAGLLIANIIMLVVGFFLLKITTNILRIPTYYIIPIILLLSTIGSFAVRNSMLDVIIMLVLGFLGYLLKKVDVPVAPIALGLILGPITEQALGIQLTIAKARGSVLKTLFLRPVSVILILLSIFSILSPILTEKIKSLKKND